jgi:hypothetical protein
MSIHRKLLLILVDSKNRKNIVYSHKFVSIHKQLLFILVGYYKYIEIIVYSHRFVWIHRKLVFILVYSKIDGNSCIFS